MKKLSEIIQPIQYELNNFEEELKKIISSCNSFLDEDLNTFIFKNPKRLRPIFIILFSKILKIENNNVLKIALATEIIHNASLFHDDIIDKEETRRNYPTFYKKFGSKIAVLEGDLLLAIALEILSETNLEILNIFSKRIKKTILGEINQNSNTNKVTDIDYYFEKTLEKTGNLFIAGLESLFSLKNIEVNIKNDLMSFLKNYTLAFQIKNDVDNFKYKNQTDFKNGNYTLPVIYFCMENSPNLIHKPNVNFEKHINLSNKKINELKNNALNSLSNIENSTYKEILQNICEATLRS